MAGVQGVYTLSGNGQGAWIPINLNAFKTGVGLLVTFSAGANLIADCFVTGDRPTGPITHQNLHDVLQGLTKSTNDSLAFPCSAIAMAVRNYVSGNVTFAVVQQSG